MKVNTNRILRFAVATAFAGASAVSYAALTAPATAVKVANELPTTGIILSGGAAQLNLSSKITNFAPSAGQNLQINVTLDNGAKFFGAPAAVCTDGANSAAGTLNLGGAGSNNAVFTVGSAAAAAVSAGLTACTVIVSAVSVTGAHNTVNASITYTYGTLASSTEAGPVISWVKGVSGFTTPGNDVVALVTGGFVNMSGGVTPTIMSAGVVTYASNGKGFDTDLTTFLSASVNTNSATLTVNGNALQAAKVTGGVYLASDTCTGTTIFSGTGGSTSVTFAGISPAQIAAGVHVCVNFSGNTGIQQGTLTASLTAGVNAGYSADTSLVPNTLNSVTRNGSSTRALNIPAANNPDQAFVRVTNLSGIAGKLFGTLVGQDGLVLGTANSVLSDATAFVPGATVVFSANDIKTKLGIATDWTGRAQLQLSAETTSIRAQNTIRVSNGTLVNMGGDTSTNNN